MIEVLAHITPAEGPSLWLIAFAGFVVGVAATYAFIARKLK